ncbi:transposase [Acinetobacter yuyunsongii]
MDNATFHKGKRLQELVRCAGHYIVWLPRYSPDLNPIDERYIVQGGRESRRFEISLELKILINYLKITVMIYLVFSYTCSIPILLLLID